MITVVRAGPLTTVQDLGRPGLAHLGVPRSGALDGPALRRANELVGNDPSAAGLETTLMGCGLRFDRAARVAVTGARARVRVRVRLDGESVAAVGEVITVPAGAVLDVGRAEAGVRSYVAVAGGIAVEPVLGSRSTDTLSGLGPPRLADGMTLPVGAGDLSPELPQVAAGGQDDAGRIAQVAGHGPTGFRQVADEAGEPSSGREGAQASGAGPRTAGNDALRDESDGGLVLEVWRGPRDDWFAGEELFAGEFRVSPVSNRVGARLAGAALRRTSEGELESEGVVLGAIQVPADGQPLIFLADHPTTGGYPVIAVVADVTPLAQARPGTTVRFRAID